MRSGEQREVQLNIPYIVLRDEADLVGVISLDDGGPVCVFVSDC